MRRKNGTFKPMQQISTIHDLCKVGKGEFFSMVYAPIEGRLIAYYADYEGGILEYRDQSQKRYNVLLYRDDFKIPLSEYTAELRKDGFMQPTESQITLVNLATELAFTTNSRKALSLVKTIQLYSMVFDLEPIALKLTKQAMDVRRSVISL